ncbi:MAG: tail fiber domain-containing protein [Marinilabiliaceae bacterium]|jgi:hypothetical protein|nr:tail fiber domain-containing protein [Marinilabiliaceae bacterium]
MKTLKFAFALLLTALFLSVTVKGQSPQQLNYQAVVRDISGNPISGSDITVTITLRQYAPDGVGVFQEIHNAHTNEYGLISLAIGSIEDLSVVQWNDGPFFLKVDVDGNETGITQLLSVPYSLYSGKAGNVFSGDYYDLVNTPDLSSYLISESDPVFNLSAAKNITSSNISNWSTAYSWGNHQLYGYLTSHIWNLANNKISYNKGYVGVGVEKPRSKLAVQGSSAEDTILFEVKNSVGQTVFAVYNQGVHITIDEDYSKGSRGGFSVGGFDRSKGIQEYLRVTADSTRVYINKNSSKGSRGGFSVGGFDRSAAKAEVFNYVDLTPQNSFIGHSAGANNSTGSNNFFGGYEAGLSNQLGSDNIFIGNLAGRNNNSNGNVFIGSNAGRDNSSAYGSVIIGDEAGPENNGARNVIIGRRTAIKNTTGRNNVYVGNDAGAAMTDGIYNTFVGAESGQFSVSGDYSVYLGTRAGYDNDGSNNVVTGYLAGSNANTYGNPNTNYSSSVLIGYMSGYRLSEGTNNVFLGQGSGSNVTTGYRNTLIGSGTGSSGIGSNNVIIGYGAGSDATGDNNFVIHNWNTGLPYMTGKFHSEPSAAWLRINAKIEAPYLATGSGTSLVVGASGEILKLSSSKKYKSDIRDLDNLTESFMNLRPVSFVWNDDTATPGKEDFGLIAEEVEEVLPELGIKNPDGTAEGVSYHNVNIMAVKVIQEQQREIEQLKLRLKDAEEKINKILEGK